MRWCVPVLLLASSMSTLLAQSSFTDEWLRRPVDDRTFDTFRSFFVYDKRLPLAAATARIDTVEGRTIERLSFQSTPDARVTANLWKPIGPAGRMPAVILLHGGGGPGRDGAGARFVSDFLSRAGLVVLAIDMQYFGERRTDLLNTFSEVEKHEQLYNQPATYLAWTTQTVKDVGRAYDFLVEQRDAAPDRVALAGVSRGAIVGFVVAGVDRRLAAFVSLYGAHADALETGHHPATCPANYVGRIAPRPLFMINGMSDTDMLRDIAVLPLQKLAKQPREFMWVEGGHSLPVEHFPTVLTWLQGVLR